MVNGSYTIFVTFQLKHAKDYSVVDGGQGVEGKGVNYVGDGAVMYRIIFSRRKNASLSASIATIRGQY